MNSSFYKNLASNTPFEFDRIYNNRTSMDDNATWDGVQIGRYVFIEYGDYEEKNYPNIIKETEENKYIFENNVLAKGKIKVEKRIEIENGEEIEKEIEILTEESNILLGEIYFDPNQEKYYEVYKGELQEDIDGTECYLLNFKEIASNTNDLLDYIIGRDSKNYDSTIWQKMYDKNNKKEYYEQIATVDTPILKAEVKPASPNTTPSVEVNTEDSPETYTFTLPKAWDFKIAEAENGKYSDEKDINGKPLNIYYNKDAFNNINFNELSPIEYEKGEYYYKLDNNTYFEIDISKEYNEDNIYLNTNPIGIESTSEEYYRINFLNENEYLWENIQSDLENGTNSYYKWGKTGFLYYDKTNIKEDNNKGNIIEENDLKNYIFFEYEDSNSSELINIANINDLKSKLNDGNIITYITYNLIELEEEQQNIIYYIKNGDSYKEIDIIKQTNSSPYWERKGDHEKYFELKQVGEWVIDNSAEPTFNRDYYSSPEESTEPVQFVNDWDPYTYYKKATSNEYLNYPYEKIKNEIYYLSNEAIQDSEETTYYKKEPYSIVEKNNQIKIKDTLDDTNKNYTKELSMILPGLGNAAADIYNLLYGKDRKSFIYSDIKQKDTMYKQDDNNKPIYNEPLYNVDEKSVVGLMNKVYDLIGHMKVIELSGDIELTELKSNTTIIPGPNGNGGVTLGEYDNLVKTLFKKGDKYYLILKVANKNDNEEIVYSYKYKEFNEKSLYYLIAEMEHLVSGSYESIFDALDDEQQITNGNQWISVSNKENDQEGRLYYNISHATKERTSPSEVWHTIEELTLNRNLLTLQSRPVDDAGHINPLDSDGEFTLYIPAAFTNATIPNKEEAIPIGSIWYDTSPTS